LPEFESPAFDWSRQPVPNVPGVPQEDIPFESTEVIDVVPQVPPVDQSADDVLHWKRVPVNDVVLEAEPESPFWDSGDVTSIPRDGRSKPGEHPELSWSRVSGPMVPTVPDTNEGFEPADVLNSIPRNRSIADEPFDDSVLDWARKDTPIDDVSPVDNLSPFARPGDVRSIPRDGKPSDEDSPETIWSRLPDSSVPGVPDEDDVFERPGDVRSIPRDGVPTDEESPELMWTRQPGDKIALMPEDEEVFERPGDVRSIPRDGKPSDEVHPELTWDRTPNVHDAEEAPLGPFVPPGQLNSVPRSKPTDEGPDDDLLDWTRSPHQDEPDMDWSAEKPEDSAWKKQEPEFDWAGGRPNKMGASPRPGEGAVPEETSHNVASPEMDWSSDKPEDASWKKEEPQYDWAGGRPDKLKASPRPGEGEEDEAEPEPEYDWSSERPDDAVWKKDEPEYDWQGGRPDDMPFLNRDGTVSTEPTSPFDEESEPDRMNNVPDDLSEYTEEDDDRPPPVTGVPCAVWTFLALGVVAGGIAATTGPAVGAGAPGAISTSRADVGGEISPVTDSFFPDSPSTPCTIQDEICKKIADAIGIEVPPGPDSLYDFGGTCQTKSRDWLRVGKDILGFTPERIRQRYAMAMVFCETDGGAWLENNNWLSDLHECDWQGDLILDPCNRVEQYEVMRLTGNDMEGTLPVELSIMSTLFELTVSDNMIRGSFPTDFALLSELDTLVVTNNEFTGDIPDYFFSYPDMVYLDFSYNDFQGTIPDDFATQSPNIRILYGEGNSMGGTIPATLGNLQSLRRAHLNNNNFEGTIPTELGKPERITQLMLHNNQLEGPIPSELGNLPQLRKLTLHGNEIKSNGDLQTDVPDEICQSPKIEIVATDDGLNCACCTVVPT